MLSDVKVPEHLLDLVVQVCSELEVDGYRPDIVAIKTAKALAALKNRTVVDISDIKFGLSLALAHRTRAGGLKPPPSLSEIEEALFKGKTPAEKVVTERKERRVDKRSYRLPPFITFFR